MSRRAYTRRELRDIAIAALRAELGTDAVSDLHPDRPKWDLGKVGAFGTQIYVEANTSDRNFYDPVQQRVVAVHHPSIMELVVVLHDSIPQNGQADAYDGHLDRGDNVVHILSEMSDSGEKVPTQRAQTRTTRLESGYFRTEITVTCETRT